MTASATMEFDLAGKLPDDTVLLEASAGTGKTYTIAHLVVRYVAERGIEIDKLLVVTFTEAATVELRDRIRKRIRDAIDALRGERSEDAVLDSWAMATSEEERELYRKRLERALGDFDAAGVSTIHGFCSRVLTQAAFESGADYAAELLTNPSALHRDLVFDHLAIEMTKVSESQYEDLRNAFGTLGESSKLLEEVVRNPEARILPEHLPSLEEAEAKRLGSLRELREAMQLGARRLREELTRAGRGDIVKGIWRKDPALLMKAWSLLDELRESERSFTSSERSFLDHLSPQKLLDGKKKKSWGALDEDPILLALEEHLADEKALASLRGLRFQRELVDRIRNELPTRKRKLGILTFDDLLGLVATSLAPKDAHLRSHLRARFRVALIDEFQDTDPIQWTIFRAIFHEGGLPLLLIGDPKQAIYSFRGADIEVYLRARDEAHARYRLAKNHRSDEPLVEAVNDVFSRFEDALGDKDRLTYERVSAAHREPRLRLDGKAIVPLQFLPIASDEANRSLSSVPDEAARWAAWQVLGFLQSGAEIHDEKKKGFRAVGPRDCAVLVSTNRRAKLVREGLASLGVPSVLVTDESVLESEEAEQLGIWLRALADPTNPMRIRAALATPLLGVTAEKIAETREDQGGAFEAWARRFTDWAILFARHGLMRALRATVVAREVEKRFLGQVGGERRMTDLWHAAELLHAAKVKDSLDAEELALYLERERSGDDTSDEARRLRLETDSDAVEIVTIHRSKGLEYPAVFCADLHEPLKTGSPLRYTQNQTRVLDLAPSSEAKEIALREARNERLRLAYVALTRARHLCLVHWAMPAKNADRQSALDWLFFGDEPPEAWKGLREGVLSHLSARYAKSEGRILVGSRGFAPISPSLERKASPDVELEAALYERSEPIDHRFRWSSYSSITSGKGGSERGGSDEDTERHAVPGPEEAPSPSERAHLPDFKHGTQLGNLLHQVFEVIDFTNRGNLEDEVASRLEHFGIHTRLKEHPNLVSDIGTMLNEALRTPLFAGDDAFCLADIPKSERLSELDFAFSIGDKEAGFRGELLLDDLGAALFRYPQSSFPEAYRDDLGRLRAQSLRGLMHGSIDLVFRRNHRYYVVDYKSNHLGKALSDYTGEKIEREMREKHYFLQARIYSLAVHRFLKSRLRDAYDADEHFGGVLYLFLRGMKEKTGARFGVYFDKPRKEDLEALDLAFRKIGDKA